MKFKKTFILLLLCTILVIPIFVAIFAMSKKDQLIEKKFNRENILLDELKLFKRDGSKYDLTHIKNNKNTILIIFNKDCEICQVELKAIADDFKKFENSNVLLISSNSESTYQFLNKKPYNLLKRKNVQLLHDNENLLYKKMRIRSTPSILVFDRNHRIKNIYEGFHSLDLLELDKN